MQVPKSPKGRIFIDTFNGRIECNPGSKLIDNYRSPHACPTIPDIVESEKRVFKLDSKKKFKR